MFDYTYNSDGIRTQKKIYSVGGVLESTINYILDGSKIIAEYSGNTYTYYVYDENATIMGMLYGGEMYTFRKNLQGDVTGIYNANGELVAKYQYDAFGVITSVTDANGNDVSGNSAHIANINPFRYRGYYYDTETGFYYLQTRYYDPALGRFINADDASVLNVEQGSLLQYNTFAYCLNDPINRIDESGMWSFSKWVKKTVATAIGAIVCEKIVCTVKEAKRVKKELDSLPEPSADITQSFRETLKTNANTVKEITKNGGSIESAKQFYDKVRNGGDWDYKQLPEYKGTFQFNERVIQAQDIGNINFGYTGKALGLPDSILLVGAGVAQIIAGTSNFSFVMASNGDDLRDQMYIAYGIKLYNEDH